MGGGRGVFLGSRAAASWRTQNERRCRHSPCCYGRADRSTRASLSHTRTHTDRPPGYRFLTGRLPVTAAGEPGDGVIGSDPGWCARAAGVNRCTYPQLGAPVGAHVSGLLLAPLRCGCSLLRLSVPTRRSPRAAAAAAALHRAHPTATDRQTDAHRHTCPSVCLCLQQHERRGRGHARRVSLEVPL